MSNNANAGPGPVEAEPNHDREKSYKAPTTPKPVADALNDLPEHEAEDKVEKEMPDAVAAIKRRL